MNEFGNTAERWLSILLSALRNSFAYMYDSICVLISFIARCNRKIIKFVMAFDLISCEWMQRTHSIQTHQHRRLLCYETDQKFIQPTFNLLANALKQRQYSIPEFDEYI